jgi:type II secretory pathway component PulF
MPRFSYTAIDPKGKNVKGTINAENAYAARKLLRFRHLHPTELAQAGISEERRAWLMSLVPGSGRSQVMDFTKQLATLLNAGIKLTEALNVLIQQAPGRFTHAVIDIRDRVVTGESFAEALADYPGYFDVVYVSMIRVGEVTGALDKSLSTIATFMEKKHRVESKVVTVMIYPFILLFFLLTAVIIITTVVIPPIAMQLKSLGQTLPLITQVLMGVGTAIKGYWYLIIVAIGLAVWGIRRFLSTPRGGFIRDKLLISLPIFGPLIKQRIVARFASTLSALLSSGLSMAESMRVVSQVTGNTIMGEAIRQARDRILSGADIATPLRESGVIDPATAHMIAVGETSGELEGMLAKIAENLEASTDIVIERLSSAIEPIILVIVAVLVASLAYGTLLPILNLSKGLH